VADKPAFRAAGERLAEGDANKVWFVPTDIAGALGRIGIGGTPPAPTPPPPLAPQPQLPPQPPG